MVRTYVVDDETLEIMSGVKLLFGISYSEQVRRAIKGWYGGHEPAALKAQTIEEYDDATPVVQFGKPSYTKVIGGDNNV